MLILKAYIFWGWSKRWFSCIASRETKPQSSINFDHKKFSTCYYLFKIESKTATQEDEQQDSIYEEIEAEIKGFFATENLSAETEKDKVLNWWNLKKTKYPHHASFVRKYLAALSHSVYSER